MSDAPPSVVGTIRPDGSSEVVVDGVAEPVTPPGTGLLDARAAVTGYVARRAAAVGPVVMEVTDPEVRVQLMVHPDGSVSYLAVAEPGAADDGGAPVPSPAPAGEGTGTHADPFGSGDGAGGASVASDDGPSIDETRVAPLRDPGRIRRRDYAAAREAQTTRGEDLDDVTLPPSAAPRPSPLAFAPPSTPSAVPATPVAAAPAPTRGELVDHAPFAVPVVTTPEGVEDPADGPSASDSDDESAAAEPQGAPATSGTPAVETPAVETPAPAPSWDLAPQAASPWPGQVHGQGPTAPQQPVVQPNARPAQQLGGPEQYGQAQYPGQPGLAPAQSGSYPQAPTGAPEGPATRREARSSFLQTGEHEAPATQGFRGALQRIGIKVSPSESERGQRADEAAVAQHWPGTRTIAVVNGKGGAGKTPTTAMLAAVFARQGGGGVLAWDNNETRGTLGWRTEQGPHESTVRDLLPRTDDLLAPSARAAEVASYVHHQTRDKYDVLRSAPHLLSAHQRISGDDFDAVHDVASKYFRMLLIDSGNDEAAEHWLRMVDHAHQLVVPLRAEDEHAEAAALLLEELAARDERSAGLASGAVVVVSEARTDASAKAQTIASGFRTMVRSAVVVPYDPAMVGGVLRFDALKSATQRAWLRAAAEVARGL